MLAASCTKVSTILVEVFANVEISLKDTRGEVIKAVTQAIESFIVNQPENKGADVKYVSVVVCTFPINHSHPTGSVF